MKKLEARNAEIVRRRLERQPIREIAEAVGMTPTAVRRICERLGVRKPAAQVVRKKPAPLSDIEKDAIRFRRGQGETLASLMECFEIGKATINRLMEEGADA